MPLQWVHGVVRGADKGHVGLLNQPPYGEPGVVLQLIRGDGPYLVHGFGRQVALIAKKLAQFQVTPVVHGVADRQLQSLGKLLQPLHRGLVTGNIVLAHPVGTHDPPLVVVAKIAAIGLLPPKPDLYKIVETAVLIDLPRRNVTVVVHQGHLFRIVVE